MPPEGVLAVVCLDNPRDNTRGKALWTSLPSLGPQEECPWRLSDVIPAQMEVVIGDGTTRRFGPGDAVLFEDLTGQGHTSRSVGGDRLTAIVPLAD